MCLTPLKHIILTNVVYKSESEIILSNSIIIIDVSDSKVLYNAFSSDTRFDKPLDRWLLINFSNYNWLSQFNNQTSL